MKTYIIDNKEYTTAEELAKDLSRPIITIYKRIERGNYKTLKIGRKRLIELN